MIASAVLEKEGCVRHVHDAVESSAAIAKLQLHGAQVRCGCCEHHAVQQLRSCRPSDLGTHIEHRSRILAEAGFFQHDRSTGGSVGLDIPAERDVCSGREHHGACEGGVVKSAESCAGDRVLCADDACIRYCVRCA